MSDTLIHFAAEINSEHEAARRAVRAGLEHARRAGDLLIQSKAGLRHGAWLPWLAEHCPTIPERTAQAYMRIAREWPTLEAKAPRVADLSIRQALHDLGDSSRRLAPLSATTCEAVAERLEHGDRLVAAVAQVHRAESRVALEAAARVWCGPEVHVDGRPVHIQPDGGPVGSAGKTNWDVVVELEANEAGCSLPERIAHRRTKGPFAEAWQDTETMLREAAALEARARDLRQRAYHARHAIERQIADAVCAEHGPAYCRERMRFRINDPAAWDAFDEQPIAQQLPWLLERSGGRMTAELQTRSVEMSSHGYAGDIRVMHCYANGWKGRQ